MNNKNTLITWEVPRFRGYSPQTEDKDQLNSSLYNRDQDTGTEL